METRQDPVPRPHAAPKYPANPQQLAEPTRPDVTVRVTVVDERPDEEEKEAGYGHGV